MMMGSFLFKQKARASLKGNWQTALVVSFFSGVFMTVAQVLQNVTLADVQSVMNSLSALLNTLPQAGEISNHQAAQVAQLYDRLFDAVGSIPQSVLIGLLALHALSMIVTPVLVVSCNRYFISRCDGVELGVKEGLLGRLPLFGRALWLHVIMFVKTFLWSMLFVIPGIIAALRYSMAPYYLAEDPTLTARQAIAKSKQVMKDKKFTYFMLQLSFVGWSLLVSAAQMLLSVLVGPVITLVAAQFMSLAVTTYLNAACAAFYTAVSRPQGVGELWNTMRSRMREMGMDEEMIDSFSSENGSDGGEEE